MVVHLRAIFDFPEHALSGTMLDLVPSLSLLTIMIGLRESIHCDRTHEAQSAVRCTEIHWLRIAGLWCRSPEGQTNSQFPDSDGQKIREDFG
jgi:hypothetical protein